MRESNILMVCINGIFNQVEIDIISVSLALADTSFSYHRHKNHNNHLIIVITIIIIIIHQGLEKIKWGKLRWSSAIWIG